MTVPDAGDGPWALFLDFDGTLVEIVERPDAVRVEAGLPDVLSRLRDGSEGALAIVTGRAIAAVDRFLAPARFDAAGLHGVEQRVGGALRPCRPEEHPALRAGIERLRGAVAGWPGVLIEDKGCSVAVHWRLAPERAGAASALAERLAWELGTGYRLQKGKAVAEVLPAHAGKGPIIRWFLEQAAYRGRRPIFIGDDLTDENGFAVVNELKGASIRVGGEPTVATHRLADPVEVRRVLARWAAEGIRLDTLPTA